jgi:dihydroorotate dehydrogenase electron transfer subunit
MTASVAENALHAAFCADRACQLTTAIVENVKLVRETYRVRFECPEIARRITPGQFVMLRLSDCDDPLLGRPLAMYDTVLSTSGEPIGLDVVYLTAGKFTRQLANCSPGVLLDVWGPLGNGFTRPSAEHVIMVAGGIGQTPFFSLGAELAGLKRYGDMPRTVSRPKQITFCYGARNVEFFAGLDDFRSLGLELHLSTDDGTLGHHGFVTDVLRKLLDDSHAKHSRQVVCCGPERMMEAVAEIAEHSQVPCQVSLETPMACGIGICFTCVAKVRQPDGTWDYKRTCVEGPVFDAEKIVW